RIDLPVPAVEGLLRDVGWTFLFAPGFHASTRHAVGPRKELGVRTAFNLLGPLTNPARPEAQLGGGPPPEHARFVARCHAPRGCRARLGCGRAGVVHGDGLEELTLSGRTTVAAVENGEVRALTVTAGDAGLPAADHGTLRGGDAAQNAATTHAILGGARDPRRDVVLLNAAAVLVVAERAGELRGGARQPPEPIDPAPPSPLLAPPT